MLGTCLENVRNTVPLVHNITNYVTVNDVANILLACGGSPIMSDEPEDVEDITSICGGLNINIGTLNQRSIEGMFRAGAKANALGHVVLLDPVVSSAMDIGDYPAGQIGTVYVFTNAERVDLYKNDVFVTTLHKSGWTALPHPPLAVDDTIGVLLETQEHFDKAKADTLRDCLLAAGRYGLAGLPLRYKLKLAWCMVRYKMSFADGVALYGKYVGNWGGAATRWRFDAKNGDTVVKSVTLCPSHRLHLEVTPSATVLQEGDTYDMAGVRVRILDENGSPAVYAQLPLTFAVTGAAALVGPAAATAEGGMGGTYLRTVGQTGTAALTVSAPQCAPATVEFTVTKKECAVWN